MVLHSSWRRYSHRLMGQWCLLSYKIWWLGLQVLKLGLHRVMPFPGLLPFYRGQRNHYIIMEYWPSVKRQSQGISWRQPFPALLKNYLIYICLNLQKGQLRNHINLLLDQHLHVKSIWLMSQCTLTALKDWEGVPLSCKFIYLTEL